MKKLFKKLKQQKQESLTHKIFLTTLSAILTAIVLSVAGYMLNTKLPDLYYQILPAINEVSIAKIGKAYRLDTEVLNLGKGPATELTIRYTFNQKIVYYDYNYSEELNGKLPSANIKGGVASKELIIHPHRLLPQDKISAKFIFSSPKIYAKIRVFSKEGMGKPYSTWKEKITSSAKAWHNISLLGQNIAFNLGKTLGKNRKKNQQY